MYNDIYFYLESIESKNDEYLNIEELFDQLKITKKCMNLSEEIFNLSNKEIEVYKTFKKKYEK